MSTRSSRFMDELSLAQSTAGRCQPARGGVSRKGAEGSRLHRPALLWPLAFAAACALWACDCEDALGPPCGITADCPDGMICFRGHCTWPDGGGPDGGDGGGGDGGSGWDTGPLPRCNGPDDCVGREVCWNGYCVIVEPDPDCQTGAFDECVDDRFCVPELQGCVPAGARPADDNVCEYIPPVGAFTPREEWVWEKPLDAPEWDEVMMTPVVIDLTGRAGAADFVVPAVIFNSFRADSGYTRDGVLRAVAGDSGQPLYSITHPDYATHPVSNIAAGDLDGDGRPEIVTAKSGGRDLICFEGDGTFKWQTQTDLLVTSWGGPAIANVDGEGPPEIVIGANVVDADGNLRWHRDGSAGDNYRTHASAPFAVPADVDDDGKMEIVTGDTLYAFDGTVRYDTGLGDGFVGLADFTGDGRPEVVVVARGSVRLQSANFTPDPAHPERTNIIWLKPGSDLARECGCAPDCGLLGPPTIADFDGDGKPEIGVAGSNIYIVLDSMGSVLWHIQSRDGSSNITGSAVFDFEGDHRAEVVYADELFLRVLRGSDGAVLYQQPHSSLTACEYPVIADVDGDHKAEIVIAQNDLMADAPQKFKGVRVFGDAQDNWVNTRRIWNQHAYSVTNVQESGAIPAVAPQNWKISWLNNFRQNAQGEGLFDAPDLAARGLGYLPAGNCRVDGLRLFAFIVNRGTQSVRAGVPVSFYRGDPRAGGTLLGTVRTTLNLMPGEGEVVEFWWRDPPIDTPLDIHVVADDAGGGAQPAGEHNECREHNNRGVIPGVECRIDT
ncbi:MAG: VCBS repeat-containing protein [Myxococcales bacterium]|nr:VCBS repeat-containing protein [Myxococcales bacterium]